MDSFNFVTVILQTKARFSVLVCCLLRSLSQGQGLRDQFNQIMDSFNFVTVTLQTKARFLVLVCSLHRSLSQEQGLRDQFNQTMDSFEERLRQRDGEIQVAQRSYDDVVAKLKAVTQERTILSSQLQEAVKSQRQEKEKTDK